MAKVYIYEEIAKALADIDDFNAPAYSDYTGHDIATAFGVFVGLLLVQAVTIFLLKRKLSLAFKEATWTDKIDHILDAINRQLTD